METAWDEVFDVVVAGSGAGGFSAALIAARDGARTLVLEKGASVGGTTRKSAAVFYVFNNKYLREEGIVDPKGPSMQFIAHQTRPATFDPDHPTLGLPEWEYEALSTYFDRASEATEALEDMGAIKLGWNPDFVDNFSHIGYVEKGVRATGHAMYPEQPYSAAIGAAQTGGKFMIEGFEARARELGVTIRTSSQVVDVVRDDDGAVTGVVVRTPDGEQRIRANAGVVFATGGFTHNQAMREKYLDRPYVGGCAVPTNTGDFVTIGLKVGADLANMQHPWRAPIVIERMASEQETLASSFVLSGQSMMIVNRAGKRVMSEKYLYHENCRTFWEWDRVNLVYPNLPLIMVWDRKTADEHYDTEFGSPIPPPDVDGYWVIEGKDLDELTENIAQRLKTLPQIGRNRELAPDFRAQLEATIERFGAFARSGVDEDFDRGGTPIEQFINIVTKPGTGPNVTMDPFEVEGPYYATILGPAMLETKGGPRVDTSGRVLDAEGEPIPGLYGAGNCVASWSAESYWGPGCTIGPILTQGYLAGLSVAQRIAHLAR